MTDVARFMESFGRVAGDAPPVAEAIARAKGRGLVAAKRLVEAPGRDPFGGVRITHCHVVHRSTRAVGREFAVVFSFRATLRSARLREALVHVAVDLGTMGPIEGFRGLEGMRYEPVDYRPRLGRGLIERAFASAREELGRRLAPLREAEERRLEGVRRASATRLRAYYHQLQREVLESERRLQRRIDSTREMLAAATTLELRSRRAERLARLEAELASARGSNDLALLRYRREMESQLAREEQRCGLEVEVALTSAAVLEHERRVDTYLLLGRHAHALLERERSHLSEPAPLACSACRAASGELALDARGRLVCPSCARVCGSCGSVRSADDPGPPPSKMLTTPCPACGL